MGPNVEFNPSPTIRHGRVHKIICKNVEHDIIQHYLKG